MNNPTLTLVDTLDEALAMREWLGQRREWLGFDIETTGLNVGRDRIRMVQVGDPGAGWAVPYERWSGLIHDTLGQYRDSAMVAHNALFDLKFLKRDGIEIPAHLVHDTMIMSHLDSPMSANGLKPTAKRIFGPAAGAGELGLKLAMQKQKWGWETVPYDFPAYWAYSALDTVLTASLAERLYPRIASDSRLRIYEVEVAAICVLKDAELAGLQIDLDYVTNTRSHLLARADELRPGLPLTNPGSDKQVIELLQRMGAHLYRRTEKGNLSCDEDALLEVAEKGPNEQVKTLARDLNEWRKTTRMVTNYFDNFLRQNVNGVLRCSVKTVGARTGRMSITQPALQTLPRGPIVRDAFVAREGMSFVLSDYDQLELRVLAHFAREEAMLEAIRNGEDLHSFVAGRLYGPNFTKDERQTAKNANFAKGYGAGIPKFAETAGIPLHAAEEFMAAYDAMFPGVVRLQQEVAATVLQQGYVETILGRKIPVEKDEAYKGTNYLVQSSATADLIKLKIVECANAGLGEFFRLPIHDELMFEVPTDILDDVMPIIQDVMTETQLFDAPCTASPEPFARWGDKYK